MYLTHQYNKCFDKIDAFETISDYVKPWIIPFAKLYVKRLIKKSKDIKNDIGFKLDYDRIVFKDYLNLMFDSLQTQDLDNLVIDLRNNGGGSHLLCLQLLYYLTDREDLKGDLKGNSKGNLKRNLTGDLKRNLKGNLKRNLKGNLKRNVKGNPKRNLKVI